MFHFNCSELHLCFTAYCPSNQISILVLIFNLNTFINLTKQFSWPPFVMGSTFLAILLIMKNRVSFYFLYLLNIFQLT
jgi:hypothetical protein